MWDTLSRVIMVGVIVSFGALVLYGHHAVKRRERIHVLNVSVFQAIGQIEDELARESRLEVLTQAQIESIVSNAASQSRVLGGRSTVRKSSNELTLDVQMLDGGVWQYRVDMEGEYPQIRRVRR